MILVDYWLNLPAINTVIIKLPILLHLIQNPIFSKYLHLTLPLYSQFILVNRLIHMISLNQNIVIVHILLVNNNISFLFHFDLPLKVISPTFLLLLKSILPVLFVDFELLNVLKNSFVIICDGLLFLLVFSSAVHVERVGYLFEVRMSEVYCGKRRSFIAKNVHVHGFFYLVGENILGFIDYFRFWL